MLERVTTKKNAHLWARDERDFYIEPRRCAEQLFEKERFVGRIWDPCAGSGNIAGAARGAGYEVFATDIVDRDLISNAEGWKGQHDFLSMPADRLFQPPPNIIGNPPFYRAKGTEAFARRALSIATGKVAIFASLPFLAGSARGAGIWADHPPTRIWIHSERPSCPPGEWVLAGNPAKGGTEDWLWLVWDLTAPRGETRLGWLRKAAA